MKKKPEGEQVAFLREVVETCVRSIAEHEDSVRIEEDVTPRPPETPQRVVFTLFVAPSDTGLVLGEKGATLDAIRRVVWTACKKTSLKCDIDLVTNGRR